MGIEKPAVSSRRKKVELWILRYIKFNLIGFITFLVGTVIFTLLFSRMGAWSWLAANAFGGLIQFSLISYFNTKKKGTMFESCKNE